jgi:hypothetical protein
MSFHPLCCQTFRSKNPKFYNIIINFSSYVDVKPHKNERANENTTKEITPLHTKKKMILTKEQLNGSCIIMTSPKCTISPLLMITFIEVNR